MAMIDATLASSVREALAGMDKTVTLEFYPHPASEGSQAMEELLTELATFSPKLRLQRMTGEPPRQLGEEENERESSVTVITVNGQPTGMRYLGFPGGHEFGPMLEAFVAASQALPTKIGSAAQSWLAALTRPLHLQVFVTPT